MYLFISFPIVNGTNANNIGKKNAVIEIDKEEKKCPTKTQNNTAKIDVLIYPNHSNGFAKVIIPDGTGPVDIILNDASGKEIRRWNSVNNQLLLDHLHTGLYLLRVYVKETGVMQINKLIVL